MKNEEKYKTAEERSDHFDQFCKRYKECTECPLFKETPKCEFAWLDLEAKKTLPCPFCGEEDIHTFMNAFGYVKCPACDAVITADTEAEAITKWNKRVK